MTIGVRVEGVFHVVTSGVLIDGRKLDRAPMDRDGNTLRVTLACWPGHDVLADPGALSLESHDADIDCMTCLVKRSRS